MIKADKYLKGTIKDILYNGTWDDNPRPKWGDGCSAYSKFVTHKVFQYDLAKGEFPINTLRTTPLRGAWYDIEAIYLRQTNIIEEMHLSVRGWWADFVTNTSYKYLNPTGEEIKERVVGCDESYKTEAIERGKILEINKRSLGSTYGYIVRKYDLMNILLRGLEENPFGRRHIMDLFQYTEQQEDPKALVPCAYSTTWSVREVDGGIRYVDLLLNQRSQDFVVTASINPTQYTMLLMVVCNHLTFKTNVLHKIGKLSHVVANVHIYNRHIRQAEELLERNSTGIQPSIELNCKPKDFYSHSWADFNVVGMEGVKSLGTKLEIAV